MIKNKKAASSGGRWKRWSPWVFLLLASLGPHLAKSGPFTSGAPGEIAATVGDMTITVKDVRSELETQLRTQGARLNSLSQEQVIFYGQQVMERLISRKVVGAMAGPDLPEEVRQEAERIIQREEQSAGSPEIFRASLTRRGVSPEQYQDLVRFQTALERMADGEGIIPQPATAAEVRAYYRNNPASFRQPDTWDLMMFVFSPKQGVTVEEAISYAAKIRPRLIAASDYKRIIEEFTQEAGDRFDIGGARTRLVNGLGNPDLVNQVRGQSIGIFGDPFRLGEEVALVRVNQFLPEGMPPLDDIYEKASALAANAKFQQALISLQERWRDEMGVRIFLREDSIRAPRGAGANSAQRWWATGFILLFGGAGLWWLRTNLVDWKVALVFCLALGVRGLYWAGTPYDLRANDAEAHLEYVEWISGHFSIPDSREGFMFYQPPAYYAVGALINHLTNPESLARGLQGLSLVVSIATLVTGLWILCRMGKNLAAEKWVWLAGLLFALHPTLILFSARVNNDGMVLLWMLAALACVTAWWMGGDGKGDRSLYGGFAFLGLAVLTKSNAWVLLPFLLAMVFIKNRHDWKGLFRRMGWSLLILTAICGWYFLIRYSMESQGGIVGNLSRAADFMRFEPEISRYFVFNPISLWQQPFIYDIFPGESRTHLWEYLFRTSLYGQVSYLPLPILVAQGLVLSGILCLPIVLWGGYLSFRDGIKFWWAPSLVILLVAAHLAYSHVAPLTSSQDFRYSALLVLPLAVLYTLAVIKVSSIWRPVLIAPALAFVLMTTLLYGWVSVG